MGRIIDGIWHEDDAVKKTGSNFQRPETQFRNWITADGLPGPTGDGEFPAETGRYHLYVSLACPWAHRTLIFRKLKGLEDHIGVSTVAPECLKNGWEFTADRPDHLYSLDFHYQHYVKAKADYSGRASVPILWDKRQQTIVSNESADIIRMLNSAFDECGATGPDFWPEDLREEIEAVNEPIYRTLNNGVYRCGFARSQAAYDEAFGELFATLEELETRLTGHRYLIGNRVTEADWRLFTTLIRFDAVYYGHFKCNRRRIVDYPNLSNFLRDLYQQPGIAATVDIDQIKRHYYFSHESINPTRIVPVGPALDFDEHHDRDRFPAEK
ncbi:MAG: glutathione S-transferase family protein [Alphaproteobacteria bacterium]